MAKAENAFFGHNQQFIVVGPTDTQTHEHTTVSKKSVPFFWGMKQPEGAEACVSSRLERPCLIELTGTGLHYA